MHKNLALDLYGQTKAKQISVITFLTLERLLDMAELHVLRRVVEQLAYDLAVAEEEIMRLRSMVSPAHVEAEQRAQSYRECFLLSLTQANALEKENYRLRASRTAQAAMERAVLA